MAGQVWAVNTLGGYFYSRQLSNVLRMNVQPLTKFRQFADVHDAAQQGKKKGNTFTWDVVSDVSQVGQVLIETNTMPETNLTITQGTLTITEAGNSIPYSGFLDNLSKYPGRGHHQEGPEERHGQDAGSPGLGPVQPDPDPRHPGRRQLGSGRDGVHERHGDWYQLGRLLERARQGHRRRHEGAQYPGVHRG